MHFYRHHIGDYRKDTSHLTPLEHGVYRQLIDQYYLGEGPLPNDINKIFRIAGARSEDEKQAVLNVLDDFFYATENGYMHKRCDKELARIYEKSEKAANAANIRWQYERNADAYQNDADALKNDAPAMLPSNPVTHNPVTHKTTTEFSPEFIRFWDSWPGVSRKGGKSKVFAQWKRKGYDSQIDLIIRHVEQVIAIREDKFIPAPMAYVNKTEWDGWSPSVQQDQYFGPSV